MKSRFRVRFRALTLIQTVLLVASISLLAWSFTAANYVAVPIVIAVVVSLQVLILIRFVEAHVDTLEEFFAAVRYEDFTRRFVEEDVDVELKEAFNRIIGKFQDARAERDLQAAYLDTVVTHVPVPFIAARADGSLSLVNNPARRLTGQAALQRFEQLGEMDSGLPARMQSIEPGQQVLLQSNLRGVPVELRVSVSEIRMAGETERLYCIENLSGELTERESSAWRNLIRVLTHEIMNTLTPVTSLAQTTATMLDDPRAGDDIRDAIDTIARRSDGLMKFVLRYRELLRIPQPVPEQIAVREALHSAITLMAGELAGIDTAVSVSPQTLEVHADRQLLDQLLLNLVRNAAQAMADTSDPHLELTGELDYGRVIIRVRDNGPGIPADVLDQVFVPFFTTRREGSGIGLSLCRQIMTAHRGEIVVDSDSGSTTVSLVF